MNKIINYVYFLDARSTKLLETELQRKEMKGN